VDAAAAEDLVDAGLVEGSSNTHSGQGTANRRFFFESGFLELLWVHDACEAQSPVVAPPRLWDRWVERGRTANPFGLCFSSLDGPDPVLPFSTWAYRPDYLSDGRHFLFADHQPLSEPEVFLLGWPQGQSSPDAEPKKHPLGLQEMRCASVGLTDPDAISGSLRAIREAGLVEIHHSATPELVIEFTSQRRIDRDIPSLGLTLLGRNPER
jgi:hypothetical protein